MQACAQNRFKKLTRMHTGSIAPTGSGGPCIDATNDLDLASGVGTAGCAMKSSTSNQQRSQHTLSAVSIGIMSMMAFGKQLAQAGCTFLSCCLLSAMTSANCSMRASMPQNTCSQEQHMAVSIQCSDLTCLVVPHGTVGAVHFIYALHIGAGTYTTSPTAWWN